MLFFVWPNSAAKHTVTTWVFDDWYFTNIWQKQSSKSVPEGFFGLPPNGTSPKRNFLSKPCFPHAHLSLAQFLPHGNGILVLGMNQLMHCWLVTPNRTEITGGFGIFWEGLAGASSFLSKMGKQSSKIILPTEILQKNPWPCGSNHQMGDLCPAGRRNQVLVSTFLQPMLKLYQWLSFADVNSLLLIRLNSYLSQSLLATSAKSLSKPHFCG